MEEDHGEISMAASCHFAGQQWPSLNDFIDSWHQCHERGPSNHGSQPEYKQGLSLVPSAWPRRVSVGLNQKGQGNANGEGEDRGRPKRRRQGEQR